MYGGAARTTGATFLFDQGSKVSHFNYFGNGPTAAAVVDALLQDRPQGFRPIGPLSWAGTSPTGARAASRKDGGRASERFVQTAKPVATEARPVRAVLEISVINGDLLFVPQPLMLRHYGSLRLTGTERVVDTLLGGAMSASLGAGVYRTFLASTGYSSTPE